jgi:ABC-2 type transport system permease protein
VALSRAAIVYVLLFAVALITGMQVGGDGVDVAGLIFLAFLVSATASMWSAGVAFRTRTIQAGPLMQMPVFVVLFLAPVYVPLALLSGWVDTAAHLNPFTPLVETGRDFIAGTHPDALLAYGIALVLLSLFAMWGVRGLRRAEQAG